jgi:hypothetical protein
MATIEWEDSMGVVTSELVRQALMAAMAAREWIRSAGQAGIEGDLVPVRKRSERLR